MEGTRIGPFQLVKRLGPNRRQQVFRALHIEQQRHVALKFIRVPSDVDRASALHKIYRETEVLKKLEHPHLVRIYGAGVEDDQIFFAFELVEGESLASILTRRGRLAIDQAVAIGKQVARALNYLHEQDLIHAKLTPDKILVQPDGSIKVADLRLNRSHRRRWDSERRHNLETAAYLAPECFTNHGPSAKSDLYSLGVILYEMLTGKLPFEPDNLARLIKQKSENQPPSVSTEFLNCPFWLDKLIARMLQPNPRARPHTAKAVSLALDQLEEVDKSKQAAAEQMSGGFTPLNAGEDKSEARRMLGREEVDEAAEEPVPFYQRVPFIAATLVVLLSIFVYALIPPSSEQLMTRAKKLMNSEDASDWTEARQLLEKVMERPNAGALAEEAETLYFESRRQSLMRRVEVGLVGLESEPVKRFYEAYSAEDAGDWLEAANAYQTLIDDLDADGQYRYVHDEAQQRLDNVEEQLAKRATENDDWLTEFEAELAKARELLDGGKIEQAQQQFQSLIERFADSPLTDEKLRQLKERLDVSGS